MIHTHRSRLAAQLGGAWRLYWGNMPLPAGAQALGTITRGESDTGALIRTAAGLYAQGNAGVLRALDQRKVQAAIDNAPIRRGAAGGLGSRAIRKQVTLDQSSIDRLRELGGGDLSAGIRKAASKI